MLHWWANDGVALQELVANMHLLFVDAEELSLATDGRGTMDTLHVLGPEAVVVKYGARGATLHHRGAPPVTFAAYPVAQVGDTTSAGDAFAGALVGLLASGAAPDDHASLRVALRMAAVVAAGAVQGVGIDGLRGLTRGEVEAQVSVR
jgi:ribokinase